MAGSSNIVGYPSPFFDVAHTYLPVTVKQLFRWCRYYFMTNPLINATVFKLAEYPVTDILVDHSNRDISSKWTEYIQDHLRYRALQIEIGLDFFCYGNAMLSLSYPFKKWLTCLHCRYSAPASKIRNHWILSNYNFRLKCPSCGQTSDAHAKDFFIRDARGIKVIRWNPEDVEITYNDVTGEYTYFYTIPSTVRNDILIGRKELVEATPQVYISALKEGKGIAFSKDNFFHMRRPSLATMDRGWGTPLLLPVLKDVFYLQIMKKAQEQILLEHIVPLRFLFPQGGSGTSDVFSTVNLVEWREHVASEIARWRWDQNYIPIMPLPIGNQTIGGDGRALLLTGEIQQWSEQIIMGMGVPREFLMGGMSYAGTNVSMRMLENAFIGYILRHKALLRWVVSEIGHFMGWPVPNTRFKPFKMADDLQRKAYYAQLNQMGKVSDTTLLADADLDAIEEAGIIEKETPLRVKAVKAQQLAQAELAGEQMLIQSRYQAKAQQAMMAAQQAPAPGEPGSPDNQAAGAPGGQETAAPAEQAPAPQQQAPAGQPPQGGAPPPADPTQQMQSPLSAGNRMGENMNVSIVDMARAQAEVLRGLPPDQVRASLNMLQMQSPELAQLVERMLLAMGIVPSPAQQAAPAVDMRPLPEQRGPRRANPLVLAKERRAPSRALLSVLHMNARTPRRGGRSVRADDAPDYMPLRLVVGRAVTVRHVDDDGGPWLECVRLPERIAEAGATSPVDLDVFAEVGDAHPTRVRHVDICLQHPDLVDAESRQDGEDLAERDPELLVAHGPRRVHRNGYGGRVVHHAGDRNSPDEGPLRETLEAVIRRSTLVVPHGCTDMAAENVAPRDRTWPVELLQQVLQPARF